MNIRFFLVMVMLLASLVQTAWSQQTQGVVLSVAGMGEVRAENDQAQASFFIEVQDKDKSVAATRVNRSMQEGTAILKKSDPQAQLSTHGYYSYPEYSEVTKANPMRTITGWRIGQYLELTTANLQQLPITVAAVQSVLVLNGLDFSLSAPAQKLLEARRLEAAYANMLERLHVMARAMGRDPAAAVIEWLDVDNASAAQPGMSLMTTRQSMSKSSQVAEPSFEPGVSTLTAHVVAKIKFN